MRISVGLVIAVVSVGLVGTWMLRSGKSNPPPQKVAELPERPKPAYIPPSPAKDPDITSSILAPIQARVRVVPFERASCLRLIAVILLRLRERRPCGAAESAVRSAGCSASAAAADPSPWPRGPWQIEHCSAYSLPPKATDSAE